VQECMDFAPLLQLRLRRPCGDRLGPLPHLPGLHQIEVHSGNRHPFLAVAPAATPKTM